MRPTTAHPRSVILAVLLAAGAASWAVHVHRTRVERKQHESRWNHALQAAQADFPLGTSLAAIEQQLKGRTVVSIPSSAGLNRSPSHDELLALVEKAPSRMWFCSDDPVYVDFIFVGPADGRRTVHHAAKLEGIRLQHWATDCM